MNQARVAVLKPCLSEAVAIGKMVADFRRNLENAVIYVYDNNSTDGTAEVAAAAGAIVRRETLQGKGLCDSADVRSY
jgi:glycosyltransferase involved in cell wall biosynthesis